MVTEGTGKAARDLDRPAAGKTGTATENKAVWFDGFTPQLAAAVGIFQGEGKTKITVDNIGEVTGGGLPTKIWTAFMKGALKGEEVKDFPPRAGLGDSLLPPPPPPPTTTAPPSTPTSTSSPTGSATTPQPTNSQPTRPGPTRTRPTGPGPTLTIPPSAGAGQQAPAGAASP